MVSTSPSDTTSMANTTAITDKIQQGVTGVQQYLRKVGTPNISTFERWLSLTGGSTLLIFGTAHDLLERKISPLGIITALLGGELLFRAATRHCYVYQALGINTAEEVSQAARPHYRQFAKAMTINLSQQDLYHFWNDFDVVQQPISTQATNETAKADAKIPPTREQELQAWQQLKQTVLSYGGYIDFQAAPGECGTEVRAVITYAPPPLGKLGDGLRALMGKTPEQQITEDLRHFKEIMEAGELPSTAGQPSGRS